MAASLRGVVLGCLTASACSKAEDAKPAPAPTPPPVAADAAPAPAMARFYRIVLAPDGGPEIPFFAELPATGPGKLINGKREEVVEVAWKGRDVAVDAPLFHTSIRATADAKGVLTGTWKIDSRTWGTGELPLRATPVDAPTPDKRFDVTVLPGEPMDLGGKTTFWRATFPDSGIAKLQLDEIAPGSFDGIMMFDTGNMAYVSGNARGGKLRLSALGGLSLYSVSADVDAKTGTLSGVWISGPKLAWNEKFTAKRGADFPIKVKATAPPRARLKMPAVAAYKGKPLIIEFGGSWCDTCKYAAVTLRELHERYRAKGLEVVTFTYEFTSDTAYNKQSADAFKAAYQLPWEVIPVDAEPDQVGDTMPAALDGIDASGFPITIFVRRDDTIESVHASFAGPENAIQHKKHVDAFEKAAAAITR